MSAPAPGRRAAPPRGLLRKLFYALTATALTLVSIEAGLRLAGLPPLPTRPVTDNPELLYQYGKFRPSKTLIWELVPGWQGIEGGRLTINSQGLRDPERPVSKPSGAWRVLCLGDSVTFGHHVEQDDPFPRRLEDRLRSRYGARIEVINTGVPGYSPFQELAWLRERGWAYGPDLVITGFVLNDVVERYLTLASYGGDNTVLGVDTTVGLNPLSRLLRRTAFYRAILRLDQQRLRRREVYSVRRLFDQPLSSKIEAAWRQTEEELSGLSAAARQHHVPLLVVSFPFRFQVQEHLQPLPQARLAAWARREAVPFLDLTPVFLELDPAAAFLDYDHPSRAGHAVAAEAIGREVERLGLGPGASAVAAPATVP